jgi:tetratricopeptide (TPR) repeat protein
VLLAGLSVFAGEFSLEAAAAICDATLTGLAALSDHSLLQRDHGRFRLHELVRQLAAGKLRQMNHERDERMARHAGYYADFLAHWSALFKKGGPELLGWDTAIEREMDEIHQAWRWSLAGDAPERLLNGMHALYLYLDLRGQVREAAEMSQALAESVRKARSRRAADDPLLRRTEAMAMLMSGAIGMRVGEIRQAEARLENAMALLDGLEAPEERTAAISLRFPLGMVKNAYAETLAAIEETEALARREGHVWGLAISINFHGLLAFTQGRPQEARDTLQQAVVLWQEQPGLAFCEVRTRVHLGLAHHALGDYALAQETQEEALRLAAAAKDYSFVPIAQCNLAFHQAAQGELALAKAGFHAGLVQAYRYGLMASVWQNVLGLGLVAAAEGHPASAVTLLSFGTGHHGSYERLLLGEPQKLLQQLRTTLAPDAYEAAEARGHTLQLESVLAGLDDPDWLP